MNVYMNLNRLGRLVMRSLFGVVLLGSSTLTALADFQPEIVGGNPANKGDWPFMVALIQAGADPVDPDRGHFCGGVLIAPDQVLTAAHCVEGSTYYPSNFEVVVGIHDLAANDGVRAQVRSIVIHPEYNGFSLAYDVALLKLQEPVDSPIAKIVAPAEEAALLAGQGRGIVLGWGSIDPNFPIYPTLLHQIELDIHTQTECAESFGRFFSSEHNVCAGNIQSATQEPGGACSGDSGGPLLGINKEGDYALLGLVSWGFDCSYERFAGVYSRVGAVRDWISSNPIVVPSPTTFAIIEHDDIDVKVGSTLRCNPGEWFGEELEFQYEWFSDFNFCDLEYDENCDATPILGAAEQELVVTEALLDTFISCRVTGSNRAGEYSMATSPVGPVLPAEDVFTDAFPPFLAGSTAKCKKGRCTVDVIVEDESEVVQVEATRKIIRSCSRRSSTCSSERGKKSKTLNAIRREDGSWRFTFKLPPESRRAVLFVSAEDIYGNRTVTPERVRVRP